MSPSPSAAVPRLFVFFFLIFKNFKRGHAAKEPMQSRHASWIVCADLKNYSFVETAGFEVVSFEAQAKMRAHLVARKN